MKIPEKLQKRLQITAYTLLGLGVVGCESGKITPIFEGETSQGKTRIETHVDELLGLPAYTNVVITKGDTLFYIHDGGADRALNQGRDYVVVTTPTDSTAFGYFDVKLKDGTTYTNNTPIGKRLVEISRKNLEGRFREMLNQALKEAEDSVAVRLQLSDSMVTK
ncbi:hypothetical protein HYT51_03125 [Candidatus Woesearchaeota archaeon]|nr:hypothetical protein [Candidatus Woesearchaeota archaeon]